MSLFCSKKTLSLLNKFNNSCINRPYKLKSNKSFNRKYSLLNPNLSIISDPDQHVIAGEGSLDEVALQLKQKKWKPFIVTDQGLVKSGIVTMVRQSFLQAGLKFTVLSTIRENPTINDVKDISNSMSKSGCDCIVGMFYKKIYFHIVNFDLLSSCGWWCFNGCCKSFITFFNKIRCWIFKGTKK